MIAIPDIHGRTFWKEVLNGREAEDIIFLGDYLDPYSFEGIGREEAIENFKEIIAFKKAHPENVTLLLGNHDIAYMCDWMRISRHDNERHDEIAKLFADNMGLFKLCALREKDGEPCIFSHSLLLEPWVKFVCNELHCSYESPEQLVEMLNHCFESQRDEMLVMLNIVSHFRGGTSPLGSMVWSDVREGHDSSLLVPGIYNVFGHTQLPEPIVTKHFACIDTLTGYEF